MFVISLSHERVSAAGTETLLLEEMQRGPSRRGRRGELRVGEEAREPPLLSMATPGRSAVRARGSLLREVVGVHALDLVASNRVHPDAEVHHVCGELGSVDEHDLLLDPLHFTYSLASAVNVDVVMNTPFLARSLSRLPAKL